MAMEIYPVVHVRNTIQALNQTELALNHGADGVYLIRHTGNKQEDPVAALLDTYRDVRQELPEAFIGINMLGLISVDAFLELSKMEREGTPQVNGLWVDDALPGGWLVPKLREEIPKLKSVRYLGGAAFKYTETHTQDPALAAKEALRCSGMVDTLTTSGEGTGSPADIEKVAAMKAVIGSQHLALASGVDISNIESYKPYVNEVLVASSIETKPYSGIFVESLLSELIQAAHQ